MRRRSRDTLGVWSEESAQDRRNRRWAIGLAVLLHLLFFRLELPESVAASAASNQRRTYPLLPARFEPPPPREQQTLPRPRARRVPVPDPTPDDPEPLMPSEEIALPADLVDTDLVLDLPDTPPPEPPAGPMRVGGDVLPPVKLYAPPPRYPEIARAAGIAGEVILEAVIDATGEVTRIRVLESLPLGLDQAAAEAVRRWRFEPATYDGRPVPVLYQLTIRFELR